MHVNPLVTKGTPASSRHHDPSEEAKKSALPPYLRRNKPFKAGRILVLSLNKSVTLYKH